MNTWIGGTAVVACAALGGTSEVAGSILLTLNHLLAFISLVFPFLTAQLPRTAGLYS